MRTVQHVLEYDGASLAQVQEMLATVAFREAVCDFQRVLRKEVSIEHNGDGMAVRIDQYQSTEKIPAFARRLAGNEIHIIQTEQWNDPVNAALHLEIPGKPARMHGSASLRSVAGGVVETVDLSIEVGIPLIGGKAESLVAEIFAKAMRAEQTVGRDWLADATS